MKREKSFIKKGKVITIKKPSFMELDYVSWLWSDEETMINTGGPIVFHDVKKRDWFERMVEPGDGKNFYCLIYNHKDNPVGEVSFHRYNQMTKEAEFNIKVSAKERGKGCGKEAIELILDYYFNEFGGEIMKDHVAINNRPGQKVLLNFGFQQISSNEDVFLLQMTKERFNDIY